MLFLSFLFNEIQFFEIPFMEPEEDLPTKEIVTTINLIQTRLLHNLKKEKESLQILT
jgi:hypothetical protein